MPIGWQEASQRGDTESCRQFETEIFDLVENNGLSEEWLELFTYLAADDCKKMTSIESTEM